MRERCDRVVIMYPDYQGKGLEEGGFADRCLERFDSVVAIVNGGVGKGGYPLRNDVTTVVSEDFGLGRALIKGYRELSGFDGVVVRVDTEEADIDKGYHLASLAKGGGAVGDLSFGEGFLRAGSADEHSSLDVFPIMFDGFSKGRVRLSGAHGFQAWQGDVLERVASLAEERWLRATKGVGMWGFDASMIMAGLESGLEVTVVKYGASVVRDREREKIAQQFRSVLNVLLEYERNGL
ncbi:MAG: hypothetical protein ACKOW9_01495 [Candidatus Paceibacterota bacterium]